MTDVGPGVDIDGRHRLGLVDDQVAAGLQRDLAIERLADLVLDPVQVEDRARPLVELDKGGRIRHECRGERHHARMLARRVDEHAAHTARQLIA